MPHYTYSRESSLCCRLLISTRFMESDGQGASINPCFWVLCLFIGPVIMSICSQWYIFMGTRALARTEGLLTQLVFEHSLRIRFKAEGSEEDGPSTIQSASPIIIPETQPVEGSATLAGGRPWHAVGHQQKCTLHLCSYVWIWSHKINLHPVFQISGWNQIYLTKKLMRPVTIMELITAGGEISEATRITYLMRAVLITDHTRI